MSQLAAGSIEDWKVSKETTKENSCIKHGGGLVAKSCPTLVTPCTVARQAPVSVGLSRSEYWSGLQFPSPGDLPNPGIKPRSPALQADSLLSEPPEKPLACSLGTSVSPCVLQVLQKYCEDD